MKDETTPITFADALNKGIEQGHEFSLKRQKRTKTVCNRIKNLRLKKDITQSELCEEIKVNRITYSGYENCRAEPPMEVLVRIADFYHVSLDYIAGRTDNLSGLTDESTTTDSEEMIQLQELRKQLDALEKRIQHSNE